MASDYWGWVNSPLMQNSGQQPQWPTGGSDSPFWDPSYSYNSPQAAADAAAARMRRQGGYRVNQWTPQQQDEYQQNVQNAGRMAGATAAPYATAGLDLAQGNYGDAAFDMLGPLAGVIRPFAKPIAAAGVGGAGLFMGGQTAADASPKKVLAAAQAAPVYDSDPDIASLQREMDRAVEAGKHSTEPGAIKAAQAQYGQRIDALRNKKRGERELADYRRGMEADPAFQKLMPEDQRAVLAAPDMDAGNRAFKSGSDKITPYAVRNHDQIQNLELGGMAAGALLPFGHAIYDRVVLGSAARGAERALGKAAATGGTDAAAETMLNSKAEQLRGLTGHNYSPFAPGHLALHGAIGTTLPFAAGSIYPNFMDAVTLPEGTEGQRSGKAFFNPLNPEIWQSLGRAAVEGGTLALGAGGVGHVVARPDVAATRGRGILSAIDKRAAGFDAPVGMRPRSEPSAAPQEGALSEPTRTVGTGDLLRTSTPEEDQFGVAGRVTGDAKLRLPRQLTNPRQGSQFKKTIRLDR